MRCFPTGVVTGESTSQYLSDCDVPKRLFDHVVEKPMLLQNPVHRITSFHDMERMRNGTKLPLENFVSPEVNKYLKWNVKNYPQVVNWLCNFSL